jgi:hypothetical protein
LRNKWNKKRERNPLPLNSLAENYFLTSAALAAESAIAALAAESAAFALAVESAIAASVTFIIESRMIESLRIESSAFWSDSAAPLQEAREIIAATAAKVKTFFILVVGCFG